MRLDKYLKVSRLIKRRTIAKEVSDAERILVNGKIAKASKELSVGDEIEITFGKKIIKVKVTKIVDSTKKQDAEDMYELMSESTK
jgi:ribosomal 50S subunit-recycling heat shock protein